ncbi:Uncharacterized protein DAT39_008119 [Clarias magur]|uniref:Uncharacterized protein n=1 Tax=Clarias magur TaxID=1594786 RepID=A0A8J4X504_CLAMG|nr:Uncharacterized protein DAT39_008119 [Clarias magur]
MLSHYASIVSLRITAASLHISPDVGKRVVRVESRRVLAAGNHVKPQSGMFQTRLKSTLNHWVMDFGLLCLTLH